MTQSNVISSTRPKNLSPRRGPRLPDPHQRPVLTAEEAFTELGIDRSTGYKAIREGTFPLPVIRVGRVIRVPTIALLRLLLIEDDPSRRVEPTPVGKGA